MPYFTLGFVPDPDHPEGRRPLALDEYGLKNRRCVEERDAASQGEMARRLEALGYELEYNNWDRARGGRVSWRIKGIDESVCTHYSTNHTRALQIARRWEAQYGRPITDAELTDQLRITRRAKSPDDKAQDLRPHWDRYRADLDAHGLGAPAPIRRDHPTGWATKPLAKRLAALTERLYSPQGLCRDGAVFSTAEIAPAVQRAAVGLHLTQDEIRQYEVGLRRELVPVREATDSAYSYWTTTTVLRQEAAIAKAVAKKTATPTFSPSEEAIRAAIAAQIIHLDAEQREAVAEICRGRGWTFIEGRAGTGKTTAIRAAVDAYRREALAEHVVVVSTAAATAERSARKLGADSWGSIESICLRIEQGKLSPNARTLVVIDEAAMVDTARMANLLAHIGKAKVVSIGDPDQLPPIGAGGWYQDARERHGATEITQVHRHRYAADLAAYNAVRDGRAPDAIAELDSRGRVHVADTPEARVADVTVDYGHLRDEGHRANEVRIVVDASNQALDVLNRFVQRDRGARGELSGDGFEVNDGSQARSWMVYAGDQVLFLASHREPGQRAIRNGTTATVLSVEASGRVRLALDTADRRRVTIRLDASAPSQPLGLAYAQHTTKIQGGEIPFALVMPAGRPETTNLNSGYSAITRSTVATHIYLDRSTHGPEPLGRIGELWSVPAEVASATRWLETPSGRYVPQHLREADAPSLGLDLYAGRSPAEHFRNGDHEPNMAPAEAPRYEPKHLRKPEASIDLGIDAPGPESPRSHQTIEIDSLDDIELRDDFVLPEDDLDRSETTLGRGW